MIKMHLYTKKEGPSFSCSKVIAWTDTQTDRPNWNYYLSTYADGNKMYIYSDLSLGSYQYVFKSFSVCVVGNELYALLIPN